MGSIADLTWTDNFASNKKPLLTDLRTALDSIQTYVNTTSTDAVNDLLIDCFPSGYAVTATGEGNFTESDLYNKISFNTDYTGGDITIASVGAWTDVDGSNAVISAHTDYISGDLRAYFQFSVQIISSNATNEANVTFRLANTDEQSIAQQKVRIVSGVNATTFEIPVSLTHEFSSFGTSPEDIKLQYFITTATNVTIKVLANTNAPLAMSAEKI